MDKIQINKDILQEYDICEFLGFNTNSIEPKQIDIEYYGKILFFKRKSPNSKYYELYSLKAIHHLVLEKNEFRKIA